jgi:hypothetical protein
MSTSPVGASMPARPRSRLLLRCLTALALVVPGLAVFAPVARATSVSNAVLTGGTGTLQVGSTLYAKEGGALSLQLITSIDAQCVLLSGAFTARQTLGGGNRASWVFTSAAGRGDGVQTIIFSVFPGADCTGTPSSGSVSFVLDNTGPVVTAALSPSPNPAGWNNSDVTITWSATDAGSGVASGPTPATDTLRTDTAVGTRVAIATDRLGNTGNGAVAVKLDKGAPAIAASRSPAANAAGWSNGPVTVSFTCSDPLSGIGSCPGSTTLSDSSGNQSVSGTAVDNAGNTSTATIGGIGVDTVPPTLSGAPTTDPGPGGWYAADVTIHWTASDALSGLAGAAPADSTISSEGATQTASASVSDRAGNTTTATSSPVKIDKTPPTTTATAPADWTAVGVTVGLEAVDGLSGVAATYYELDGDAPVSGTSVPIASDGVHDLRYWSVDTAGNAETPTTVQVKIDKTAPTIHHARSPEANEAGWNDGPVTVTFICEDGTGSGVASCTPRRTLSDEGANQKVAGTATDVAGNTATDETTVSIDTTAPTVKAAVDRPANEHGWYDADVTVTYSCVDALSGIANCPAAQTVHEGAAGSAKGTARDVAGNTASAGVSGIDVDTTPPTLSGVIVTDGAHDGWYAGDVAVRWTARDDLSGLDGDAVPDSVVSGEGDDLSAAASVSDKAGNTTNAVVTGIKIDRTAPTTEATLPDAPSGWYAGNLLVTLTTGSDLSGVHATYYSVDGGPSQTYTGPFRHSVRGEHTLTFWSVDTAGNVEDRTAPGHSITLKVDGAAPTITGARLPNPNENGWNNGPVTVTFACKDEGTGIALCSGLTTLESEGSGQSVTGHAQDNLGSTSETTVGHIAIDLTKPTVTGTPTTAPNAFGWYRGDVAIRWTGQDGLSGVDPGTLPADSVIKGEGSSLGAGPVSVGDLAGNTTDGSVTGIKIDRTAPTVTGSVVDDSGGPRSPNAAGWYDSAVRLRFACADTLSGVQDCAGDVVLDADGADQKASGTASDRADNAASTTVDGIDIDSRAPKTDADLQCTAKNGYCRGDAATVLLTAADQPGLSGVKEIRFSTDDGSSWRSAPGDSAAVDVALSESGTSRLLFSAVDNAGNRETQNSVEVRHDTIAPALTHTLTPAPNADGWNTDDVTVHFSAHDDPDGAGVDASTVTADKTVSTETEGTLVRGSAEDRAGNVGTDSVTVKLDKTAPTIRATKSGTLGRNGWYTGPVTVTFDCADQGTVQSGTSTCGPKLTLSDDGRGQSVAGAGVDIAGNAASTTVAGIDIDSTRPVISNPGATNDGIYTLGDPAIPTSGSACTASDAGSGVDSCVLTVAGGQPNGVGTFTFGATATDRAGNTTTRTGSYRVLYRWDGFRQPINDTAHLLDQSLSVFKGGSTVPAKFQLKRADGTVVQAIRAPQWLPPVMGSPTTALVGELLFSDAETSGTDFRWDAGGQQYQYNWSTKGAAPGYQYQVRVALDDGRVYGVTIALR